MRPLRREPEGAFNTTRGRTGRTGRPRRSALLLTALAARRAVVHVAAAGELRRTPLGLRGLAARTGLLRGSALVAAVTTHDVPFVGDLHLTDVKLIYIKSHYYL